MATTFTPNHEAQMVGSRLDVVSGVGEAGAVRFWFDDVGADNRFEHFDTVDAAFKAVKTANALLARVFPKAGAL